MKKQRLRVKAVIRPCRRCRGTGRVWGGWDFWGHRQHPCPVCRYEKWITGFVYAPRKRPNAAVEARRNAVASDVLLERLAKWIVNHPPQFGGDHACRECYPQGDMIQPDFVCAYHESLRIMSSSNAPAHAGTVASRVKPVVGNSGISKKSLNILAADEYEEYGDDPM